MAHTILHWPKTKNGNGYAVCECGATIQIKNGKPVGVWHACLSCAPQSCPKD